MYAARQSGWEGAFQASQTDHTARRLKHSPASLGSQPHNHLLAALSLNKRRAGQGRGPHLRKDSSAISAACRASRSRSARCSASLSRPCSAWCCLTSSPVFSAFSLSRFCRTGQQPVGGVVLLRVPSGASEALAPAGRAGLPPRVCPGVMLQGDAPQADSCQGALETTL